ncbi:hypothetical protein ACE1B6_04255 [Aerosakkonemataceae cyanobacterium BLCC-F154]|uniref:Uncharacterized protein n=1 Tax=Floridaenema fluviatile BLCC-F154 TaxID=3153640 RepID=A0ABV4Y8L4_9CYAN
MANNGKWASYEAALLQVMGCDYEPYPEYWWWYRFLFIPSFAVPSCLIISGNELAGELHFAVLKEQPSDIFEVVYLSKETDSEDLEILRVRQCREMMELLTNKEVQQFRQHLATIQPMLLPDLKFWGRDGIFIRCWCQESGKKHTFEMSHSNAAQSPKYKLLLSASLQLLKPHITDPILLEYLAKNWLFSS